VAITPDLLRNGAVGFIAWLDLLVWFGFGIIAASPQSLDAIARDDHYRSLFHSVKRLNWFVASKIFAQQSINFARDVDLSVDRALRIAEVEFVRRDLRADPKVTDSSNCNGTDKSANQKNDRKY
jgi:hypothetical protein